MGQSCPHAYSCLTCPLFLTTAEFLPRHRQQHQQTLRIISTAQARGHARMVEMYRQVVDNLERIITARSRQRRSGGGRCLLMPPRSSPPPASAHELTRSRAIQALRQLDSRSGRVRWPIVVLLQLPDELLEEQASVRRNTTVAAILRPPS